MAARGNYKAHETFKMPWVLLGQDFYQGEMARLLMDSEFKLDPEDYDFNKGGLRYDHGKIDRAEADARLSERNIEGAFLTRIGSQGQHVISTITRGVHQHIVIKTGTRGGVMLGSGPELPSITQMMIANFDRELKKVAIKFSVPLPPMIRTRNVNGSSADSPSPHITITDTAQPRSRQGSNASTLSNTSSEFRHRTSTNPFEQAPAPTNPSIDKTPVVVEDLSVGDLRKLLQQHKIDYRTANGRVELEMLATGLYWIPAGVVANQRSGSDRSSSVSQRSSSNPNSIEVPAPLVRSNSTGRIDRETKPAAGNPPKSSSALSLFAQYKQKSGGRSKPKTASNPTQPRNPTTTSDATPITSSNSTSSCPSQSAGDMFKTRNNPRVSQQSVSSVSSVSSSTSSTVTFGDDVEPIKSKRLSAMATDFFGSLRADSTESVTSVNSVFETSKPTTQQQQQEQPSINEQDENNNNHDEDNNNNHDEDGNASLDDVSEDDLSDDDTSDDDDDDDDEDDGVAQKGGKKASDTFWAKMQDSSTTAEADSTGGDVAAELRKAKRREKLAAMVKKF